MIGNFNNSTKEKTIDTIGLYKKQALVDHKYIPILKQKQEQNQKIPSTVNLFGTMYTTNWIDYGQYPIVDRISSRELEENNVRVNPSFSLSGRSKNNLYDYLAII